MENISDLNKVYSPDIQPFGTDGNQAFFGTISSIIVAPIRLVIRVMHNIFILPADLLESYANSLLLIATALEAIGLIDLFVVGKWPLAVSQIPTAIIAIRLRGQAQRSRIIASEKREVDINVEQVEQLCNTIYDELDRIIKE